MVTEVPPASGPVAGDTELIVGVFVGEQGRELNFAGSANGRAVDAWLEMFEPKTIDASPGSHTQNKQPPQRIAAAEPSPSQPKLFPAAELPEHA